MAQAPYSYAFYCSRAASTLMVQFAVLIGLLLATESQASDVAEADPSTVQGFLPKMENKQKSKGDQFASSGHAFANQKFPNKDSKVSDAMKSSGGFFDSQKFIVPTF